MATTLQSQKQEIESAISQAQLTRKQIEEQKRQAEAARMEIVAPRKRQAFTERKEREKQRKFVSEEIPEYKRKLGESEEQFSTYEGQLLTAKQNVERAIKEQEAYELAEKYAYQAAVQGKNAAALAAYFNLKREGFSGAYKYYTEMYGYYKNQNKKPTQPENPYLAPEGMQGFSTKDGIIFAPIPDVPKVGPSIPTIPKPQIPFEMFI
jgi:hypothetical protein